VNKQNTMQKYVDAPKVSFGIDAKNPLRPYYIMTQTDERKEYMRFSADEARHFTIKGWGIK
jgi:hypothetical protein